MNNQTLTELGIERIHASRTDGLWLVTVTNADRDVGRGVDVNFEIALADAIANLERRLMEAQDA